MRRKISAAFAILMAVVFTAFGYLFLLSGRVENDVNEIIGGVSPITEATFEVEINSNGLSYATLAYLQGQSGTALERAREDMDDLSRWSSRLSTLVPELAGEVQEQSSKMTKSVLDALRLKEKKDAEIASLEDVITRFESQLPVAPQDQSAAALRDAVGVFHVLAREMTRSSDLSAARELGAAGDQLLQRLESLKGVLAEPVPVSRAIRELVDSGVRIQSYQREIARELLAMIVARDAIDDELDETIQPYLARKLNHAQDAAGASAAGALAAFGFIIPVALLVAAAVLLFVLRNARRPLVQLTSATEALGEGDLAFRVPEEGNDEFTSLAKRFNTMAELLESAHAQSEERGAALRDSNDRLWAGISQLERRNHQMATLNDVSELIQASIEESEVHDIIADGISVILPEVRGGLYIIEPSGTRLDLAGRWGHGWDAPMSLTPSACWGLRRGRIHSSITKSNACRHVRGELPAICIPLTALGETLGLVVLDGIPDESIADETSLRGLGEHLSLGLANFRLREKLRHQSIRDPLTGLFNRRYLEETLDREISRAVRDRMPLSVVMLDVDRFKDYNDTHGHTAGDEALVFLSVILREGIRSEDIACRYGGEEFILVMPGATSVEAFERAEQLRDRFSSGSVELSKDFVTRLSFSAGIASMPPDGSAGPELIERADDALYAAKRAGRDRSVLAGITGAGH